MKKKEENEQINKMCLNLLKKFYKKKWKYLLGCVFLIEQKWMVSKLGKCIFGLKKNEICSDLVTCFVSIIIFF